MAKKRVVILMDPVELGRKGGQNSRKNFTPAERKELAQRAAKARWAKKKRSS